MSEKIKIDGPPGCGKTHSLMMKYANLITNEGYEPSEITCTTFRKIAAGDLIRKVEERTGTDAARQHVGTMHSICNRLLGYPEVVTPADINRFSKEYGYISYMGKSKDTVYSGDLLDMYNWLSNTQTPVEKWYRYPGADKITLPSSRVSHFIDDYTEYKQKIGKIDFSDMIEHVLQAQISLDTPALMVDEFQDLTRQQYELFKMWDANCEAVMIAGDPLQSIYGFWGGSPDYFNSWEGQEDIKQESRRLKTPIWDLAVQILADEKQYPPSVKTRPTTTNPIISLEYSDPIPDPSGTEFHLVRCNYQALPIARMLADLGRPFGGLYGWTEAEIGLHNTILKVRAGAPLSKFDMLVLVNSYPKKLFNYPGKKADFIDYLQNGSYSPTLAGMDSRISPALYNELRSGTPLTHTTRGDFTCAKIQGALNHRSTPITPKDCHNCQILTIHGAKGLEADTVYLHTGITPRIKENLVIPGEESAAESRVWYVGITRAKDWLYVIRDAGHNYQLPEAAV